MPIRLEPSRPTTVLVVRNTGQARPVARIDVLTRQGPKEI
jgi:hypothetical protein